LLPQNGREDYDSFRRTTGEEKPTNLLFEKTDTTVHQLGVSETHLHSQMNDSESTP